MLDFGMELPVELGLSRIQHVKIPVSQIDTSVGFYSSLGFKEIHGHLLWFRKVKDFVWWCNRVKS